MAIIGGVFGVLATGFTINYLTLQIVDMVVGLDTWGKSLKAIYLLLSTICGLTSTIFSLPSIVFNLIDVGNNIYNIFESIVSIAGLGGQAYGWTSEGANNVFTDVFTYFATGDDTGVSKRFFGEAIGLGVSGVLGGLMIAYGSAKQKRLEFLSETEEGGFGGGWGFSRDPMDKVKKANNLPTESYISDQEVSDTLDTNTTNESPFSFDLSRYVAQQLSQNSSKTRILEDLILAPDKLSPFGLLLSSAHPTRGGSFLDHTLRTDGTQYESGVDLSLGNGSPLANFMGSGTIKYDW